jgi:hypothetical protein
MKVPSPQISKLCCWAVDGTPIGAGVQSIKRAMRKISPEAHA